MPVDLGMASSAMQEGFGDAFLLAVAGAAGCAVSYRRPDDDSVDWTLSCKLPRRPKIDVQMKTWVGDDGLGDVISYPLKRKNYDDLILTDVFSPRILVLVTLPNDTSDWLKKTPDQLVLHHCATWVSLAGYPASANALSVTVKIPRSNLLDVNALVEMMHRVNDGAAL